MNKNKNLFELHIKINSTEIIQEYSNKNLPNKLDNLIFCDSNIYFNKK